MIRRMQVRSTLLAALLMAASLSSLAATTVERPLVAGRSITIGTVTSTLDGSTLTVKYAVTSPGWVLESLHLYVGTTPPKSAAPGQFPFAKVFSAGVGTYSFVIDVSKPPVSWKSGNTLYIAAHANACEVVADYAATELTMPTTYTLTVVESNHVTAYMNLLPQGYPSYKAWCVDRAALLLKNVVVPTAYEVGVFPDESINPAVFGMMGAVISVSSTNPVQLLTYLLNQSYVKNCGAGGPYSVADIQFAIWSLTNGTPLEVAAAVANPDNVRMIVADVMANGPLFQPQVGDLVVGFAQPRKLDAVGNILGRYQPLLFGVVLQGKMGSCGTAWGVGTFPFRTGWGSYFVL